jgi:GxxExxY protein
MTENQITSMIIGMAIDIHKKLGPGLLESVYHRVMAHKLTKEGLKVESEKIIAITFEDLVVDRAFKVDLIVENKILVELKSVKEVPKVDYKRFKTYLAFTNLHVGIFINFGEEYLKDGIKRVINGYETEI